MKKKIEIEVQRTICDTYLIHRCNRIQKINYRKTSHTWAEEVSKWAGVVISPFAWEWVCIKYQIKRLEMTAGVNCYALETMK